MYSQSKVLIGLFAAAFLCLSGTGFAEKALTNDEIKQILIQRSLTSYPGNCPCPYNTDRAGRRCGKRSAYSKPGGYAPLCYPEDVTAAMIAAYKKDKQ